MLKEEIKNEGLSIARYCSVNYKYEEIENNIIRDTYNKYTHESLNERLYEEYDIYSYEMGDKIVPI